MTTWARLLHCRALTHRLSDKAQVEMNRVNVCSEIGIVYNVPHIEPNAQPPRPINLGSLLFPSQPASCCHQRAHLDA